MNRPADAASDVGTVQDRGEVWRDRVEMCVGEDWSSGAAEAPVPQWGEGELVLAGEWRNGVLKGMAGVNQKKGKLGMRGIRAWGVRGIDFP